MRIKWIPGHCGVQGNELADMCTRDEAERVENLRAREGKEDVTRQRQGAISITFIKAQARIRANKEWKKMIARLNSRRGYTTVRKPRDRIPGIPLELQEVPKELASRFFQLASGHAMIAPFLREKLGWIDSDVCWWCSSGRQTREHLFRECSAWAKGVRELWEEVGRVSGTCKENRSRHRGRKGFYLGRQEGGGTAS